MNYYKVIKNGRVIDVLTQLRYVKYQKRNDTFVNCDIKESNGVLSSDNLYTWRTPVMEVCEKNLETVEIKEVDEYEYMQLKALNGKTAQEIIDDYTLSLMESGVLV